MKVYFERHIFVATVFLVLIFTPLQSSYQSPKKKQFEAEDKYKVYDVNVSEAKIDVDYPSDTHVGAVIAFSQLVSSTNDSINIFSNITSPIGSRTNLSIDDGHNEDEERQENDNGETETDFVDDDEAELDRTIKKKINNNYKKQRINDGGHISSLLFDEDKRSSDDSESNVHTEYSVDDAYIDTYDDAGEDSENDFNDAD